VTNEPRPDTDPPAGDPPPTPPLPDGTASDSSERERVPFGFRQHVDERKPEPTKDEATRSLTSCTAERVGSSWVQRPGYQPADVRATDGPR
jgi:hypothetical protein